MGVNLTDLVHSKPVVFEDLKGKKIAIDSYNTIYQFLSIIRDRFTGEPLRDSQGNITSHLSGLFYRTSRLLEAGIEPVFIFDGKPPDFKKGTQEQRRKIKEEAERKWKEALEAGDVEKVKTYAQATSRLTQDMVQESKSLLEAMGVSWVQAPSEGEAQAAFYVRQGKAWAAGSQDWDSLLFGTPRMIKNLTISGRKKLPMKEKYIDIGPELIELQVVLDSLKLTHEQLIIIGILTGTDYNPGGVKGIGPKKALKLVTEQKTLENTFKNINWEFDMEPQKIFDFFIKPPVEDLEIPKFRMDRERLLDIMVNKHDFSEERISSTLKKLESSQEDRKQSSLGKFFG